MKTEEVKTIEEFNFYELFLECVERREQRGHCLHAAPHLRVYVRGERQPFRRAKIQCYLGRFKGHTLPSTSREVERKESFKVRQIMETFCL